MKRLTLGLSIIFAGITNTSLANCCDPRFQTYIPLNCGGFEFGVTALYWRYSIPQLDFALITAFDTDSDDEGRNSHYKSLDPDHDWGFQAFIGYTFPCSANDVRLTYTHYNQTDNDRVTDDAGVIIPTFGITQGVIPIIVPVTITLDSITPTSGVVVSVDPPLPASILDAAALVPFQPIVYDRISIRAKLDHNAVDLDFGQTFNLGCHTSFRWFGGLRYANFEKRLDVNLEGNLNSQVNTITTFNVTIQPSGEGGPVSGIVVTQAIADLESEIREIIRQKSEFDGIGPRFGVEGIYHIGNSGFGIVAGASSSLLVGAIESSIRDILDVDTHFVEATAGIIDVSPQQLADNIAGFAISSSGSATPTTAHIEGELRFPNETRIVPNVDAKIGLNYTYQFCNPSHSKLRVDAGYCVSQYWNVVDVLSLVDFDSQSTRSRHANDLNFNGPFIGIEVQL